MTPGARVATAIEILDDMAEGLAAEQALTRWARRSRFAGSKDRAAIRDHVFDVLRCRHTVTHFGQGHTGRAMMIGLCHVQGIDPATLFTGEGHAPAPLNDDETATPDAATDQHVLWNLPAWLVAPFQQALGPNAAQTARALQARAPICLRVNLAKATVAEAANLLASEGVATQPNPLAEAALTVTDGMRKVINSNTFQDGLVELQDAASQAVVAALPTGGKVLDYCAGGGGKALGLAMDTGRSVYAHDIDPARMRDLPVRAARADARIVTLATAELATSAPYDTVLCDAPCSGSGAWRRAAEGKWTLTPARLTQLSALQDNILDQAAQLVRKGGVLAYATCSVLQAENEDRVAAFLARTPGWHQSFVKRFDVDKHGDGFFTAHLTHE